MPHRCRRQADRHRRPHRRRRPRRPHRRSADRRRDRRREELLRRPRQAEPVPAVVHRRDLHRRPSGARDGRARPTAPTCAWPRRASSAGRSNFVVNAYAVKSVNEGVSGDDWSYGFSAHYPNDRFNAQVVVPRDPGELQAGARLRAARQRAAAQGRRQLQPAAEGFPERPADVPRRLLHALHAAGQRRGRELGPLRDAPRLAPQAPATTCTGCSTSIPTYERLFEPFEISPGVFLLPGEYRFTRFRSNLLSTATKRRLSGSVNLTYGGYWSGKRRAGDDEPHLQAAAAVHGHREHQPDVRAAARKATSSRASSPSNVSYAARRGCRCRT